MSNSKATTDGTLQPLPRRTPRLRGDGGQGIVEFALILPVFMLLILGMIDFGSAYNIHNNMTQLAGEAVRYAAVNNCGSGCTGGDIVSQVQSDADNGCLRTGSCGGATGPDQRLVVCFWYPDRRAGSPPSGGPQAGDQVQAVVETNYRWLPFLGLAKVKLRATATMRIEVAPTGSEPPDFYQESVLVNGDCPDYSA